AMPKNSLSPRQGRLSLLLIQDMLDAEGLPRALYLPFSQPCTERMPRAWLWWVVWCFRPLRRYFDRLDRTARRPREERRALWRPRPRRLVERRALFRPRTLRLLCLERHSRRRLARSALRLWRR